MRLIITGASGNIGRMIIPILANKGIKLMLVGRDADILIDMFPEHESTTYQELNTLANQYDGVLHLAVLNNDKQGVLDDFKDVNIELLKKTLSAIEHGQLKFFIYPTSLHSIATNKTDYYSKSKRMVEDLLIEIDNIPVRIMRLPAVYGDRFSGKLAVLNSVPQFLRGFLFNVARIMKPTVSAHKVVESVLLGEQNEFEFLVTDQQENNWVYKLIVKLLDLSFTFFVISIFWWLILLCIIIVKLSSTGPGIFAQTRVGRNGKNFVCYKLRTMKAGTSQRATHEVTVDNITGFGHFLRKSKIDELPQVLNILKGEMSVIGPRPCLPSQNELINERSQRGVLKHKPGITGWSQVNRIDMSDPEKLAKSDEYFIKMKTLPMLLQILFATLFRKF